MLQHTPLLASIIVLFLFVCGSDSPGEGYTQRTPGSGGRRRRKRAPVANEMPQTLPVGTKVPFVSRRVKMFARQSWMADKSKINILDACLYGQV